MPGENTWQKLSPVSVYLPVQHVLSYGIGFDNDFFKLGDYRLELPPDSNPTLRFSTKDRSWAAWYNGQLAFWTHPEDEERQSGLFFRFGYADDETNFFEWNFAGGIGGTGPFDSRPRDRYGIGVYYIEPSDEFPLPAVGIDEEMEYEAFYNCQVIPNLEPTLDLQYIASGMGRGPLVTEVPDNAWIGGL